MKRIIALFFSIISYTCIVFAQNGAGNASGLEFLHDTHDFGEIPETGGTVRCTFYYKNTTARPVIILSSAATCGCVLPSYTRKPVAPGADGAVTVAFDPSDRLGAFSKELSITTNVGTQRLRIKGTVTSGDRSVERTYPYACGPLRLSARSLNFGNLPQGEEAVRTFRAINTSKKQIRIDWSVTPDAPWLITPDRRILGPGEAVTVTLVARFDNLWGRFKCNLQPSVDGTPCTEGTLSLLATGIDRFDNAAERTARLVCTPSAVNLAPGRREASVTLHNEGTAPLVIRWANPSAGLQTDLRSGEEIAPGRSRTIRCRLSDGTDGTSGAIRREALILITNDPGHPVYSLRIAARQ